MEKYDITKPFLLPVGMYKLNKNPGYSFQLNRLVNMDLGDLDEVRRIAEKRNAIVRIFMDYDAPDNNACWQKARELFFLYFEDFFKGEHPKG